MIPFSQPVSVLLYFCSASDTVFFCYHTGKKCAIKPVFLHKRPNTGLLCFHDSKVWTHTSPLTVCVSVVVLTLVHLHLSVHTFLLCFTRLLFNVWAAERNLSIMKLLLLLLIPVCLSVRRGVFHIYRQRGRTMNRWDYKQDYFCCVNAESTLSILCLQI